MNAVDILAVVFGVTAWIVFCSQQEQKQRALIAEASLKRVESDYQAVLLKYFEDTTDPRFERAPDWTPDDALALQSFLRTEPGQALTRRFAAAAAATAIAGCADAMHTAHSAGNASGWNEAYEWFLKLSRVTGEQVTKRASDSGDPEQPIEEDEAALLERFSS